ncbi:MAG: hypothetical protein JXA07_04600 [Spirochaetes bacterium]|nr:hypothetical protein [Spirochaetota bacterium]
MNQLFICARPGTMSENLIEDIKNAEKKASAIIDEAERESREHLRLLREECEATIRDMLADFPAKKRKALEDARRDAGVIQQEQGAENDKELARLKHDAGERMEETTSYIITGLLGI